MKIIDVRLFLPKTNSCFNDNGSAQRSSYRAWVITCASPIQCTSSTLTRRSVPPGWGRDRNTSQMLNNALTENFSGTRSQPCTVPGTRPRFKGFVAFKELGRPSHSDLDPICQFGSKALTCPKPDEPESNRSIQGIQLVSD